MNNKYTDKELNIEHTQASLSKVLEVSRAYISKLVKANILILNNKKKITLIDALKQIKENSNPSYASKINEEEVKEVIENNQIDGLLTIDLDLLTFNEAKTVKERYLAGKAKLEYQTQSKELIDAEQVKKDAFNIARKLRDNLLNIPDRLADILAAESDSIKIRQMINSEIKQVLEEIEIEIMKDL